LFDQILNTTHGVTFANVTTPLIYSSGVITLTPISGSRGSAQISSNGVGTTLSVGGFSFSTDGGTGNFGIITQNSGNISFGDEHLKTTGEMTASDFIGDGSQLTNVPTFNQTYHDNVGNSSWNQTIADTLYADISVSGDNSSWNETDAYTKYLNRSSEDIYLSTYNESYDTYDYNQTTPAETYADSLVILIL